MVRRVTIGLDGVRREHHVDSIPRTGSVERFIPRTGSVERIIPRTNSNESFGSGRLSHVRSGGAVEHSRLSTGNNHTSSGVWLDRTDGSS